MPAKGLPKILVLGKGLCERDELLALQHRSNTLRRNIYEVNVIADSHEDFLATLKKNRLANGKLTSGVAATYRQPNGH